jgi:glutamate/tyrosine decarboxylase-like PLP-dependent enzyme
MDLFDAVVELVQEFLASSQDRASKVVDFKQPEELQAMLDLSLRQEPASREEVLQLCRKALQYSVHTAHPRMFNCLWSGVDEAGLCGMVLATAANTNVYTYEMAPVFNLMEKEVLKKMRELIGWSRGSGIFAPGGSLSNLYGLMAARYHRFPESKTRGCAHLPQMAIFASCESHYSVEKSAILLGLGTQHVVKVKCDVA